MDIGALERFVLSIVDGASTAHDVAQLTGLADHEVEAILDRLVKVGAIERVAAEKDAEARPDARSDPSARASSGMTAPSSSMKSVAQKHAATSTPDDQVELEEAMKTRIVELSNRLDELDHYALLGVAREADKKAIKSAYYGIAAKFHTDRYFGKNLGRYKTLMEQIFSKATLAHEALANKARRAEYDQYLQEKDRTSAYEKLLAAVDDGADFFAAERASSTKLPSAAPITDPIMVSAPTVSNASNATQSPAPASEPKQLIASTTLQGMPLTPLSPDQERSRRESLARRLAGSRSPPPTGRTRSITLPQGPISSAPPKAPPPSENEVRAATESIKRVYEERRDSAKKLQAQKFIDAGQQALGKDDVVTAATHYRLAVKYTDDPAVHATYVEVNKRARDLLCDAYLKQGKYEEQQQKWHEASVSYVKALDGRPDDASIAERAASMLLREGRDLRRAGRYAELAVQKNPNNPAFRVTLASVYLEAGLFLRARSELEHALKLSPSDAKVKELLAHARKMVS